MSQFLTKSGWCAAEITFVDGTSRTHEYHTMQVPTGSRILEFIGETTLVVSVANMQTVELKDAP